MAMRRLVFQRTPARPEKNRFLLRLPDQGGVVAITVMPDGTLPRVRVSIEAPDAVEIVRAEVLAAQGITLEAFAAYLPGTGDPRREPLADETRRSA